MRRTLSRPDYVLQPGAVLRRLRTPYESPGEGTVSIVTPAWGMPVEARTDESIGYSMLTTRVFDLAVTETLLRLPDPGELAIDVGANIGCMSGPLAAAVGSTGEVWSFEPSPAVLPALERVTASWSARVKVWPIALSDSKDVVSFVVPVVAANGGMARVGDDVGPGDEAVSVETARLDDLLDGRRVGVMKLDAERHEPQILAGAERMLREQRVRDVIFEDIGHEFPTTTSRPLVDAGYTIFALGRTFFGPRLDPPGRITAGEEEQSYLATTDPERATARLRARGWRCLGR